MYSLAGNEEGRLEDFDGEQTLTLAIGQAETQLAITENNTFRFDDFNYALKKYFSIKRFLVTLGISIVVSIISSFILSTLLIKTFIVVIFAILINGLVIAFEKGDE